MSYSILKGFYQEDRRSTMIKCCEFFEIITNNRDACFLRPEALSHNYPSLNGSAPQNRAGSGSVPSGLRFGRNASLW